MHSSSALILDLAFSPVKVLGQKKKKKYGSQVLFFSEISAGRQYFIFCLYVSIKMLYDQGKAEFFMRGVKIDEGGAWDP